MVLCVVVVERDEMVILVENGHYFGTQFVAGELFIKFPLSINSLFLKSRGSKRRLSQSELSAIYIYNSMSYFKENLHYYLVIVSPRLFHLASQVQGSQIATPSDFC